MRKKIFKSLSFLLYSLLVLTPLAEAQHGHGGGEKDKAPKMEAKEVLVEGIKIAFMVMTNEDHQKMLKEMKIQEAIEPGTTHNISVILRDEKSNKELAGAKVSMKVIDPKNKDQVKTLRYVDNLKSYDAYFNLSEKGKYQILVLRTAGISYEIK